MGNETGNPKIISAITSFTGMTREVILTGVILLCIFRPTTVPRYLCDAGFKEVKAFDVAVAPECIAKQQVSSELLKANTDNVTQTLEQKIEQPVAPAAVQAVAQAQAVVPSVVTTAGWIFLGRVKHDQKQWELNQPQTIESIQLPIQSGSKVKIKDDVYLRADVPSAQYKSSGSIVSVARIGESYEIEQVEPKSAKIGGYYLWARVHAADNH